MTYDGWKVIVIIALGFAANWGWEWLELQRVLRNIRRETGRGGTE